jgi:hypothetical protein
MRLISFGDCPRFRRKKRVKPNCDAIGRKVDVTFQKCVVEKTQAETLGYFFSMEMAAIPYRRYMPLLAKLKH